MTNLYLSALIDHLPIGILLLDSRGTINYAGCAIEPILGYQHRNLIGTNVSCLIAASPSAMMHWYQSMITRRGVILSMPLPMKTHDNVVKLIDCTLCNLLDHECISGVLLTLSPVQDPISCPQKPKRAGLPGSPFN